MDETKLLKLLKQHFPTKKEQVSFRKDFDDFVSFVSKNIATKTDLSDFINKKEFLGFKTDINKNFYDIGVQLNDIKTELKEIRSDIGELKPSARSLDKILEQHPVERIARLEKHSKLPPFKSTVSVG